MGKYKYKYDHWRFTEGGLDEKIAYDRYSTPEHDINKINVGDIVVCKLDRNTDKRAIGVIKDKSDIENVVVEIREKQVDEETGQEYLHTEVKTFHHELISKPLDLKPIDFWERWAKAGASVEKEEKREEVENMFRELFDGYRYSPGGRIQLMAGQELVTGKKANLTAFNCFVIPSPKIDKSWWESAKTDRQVASKVLNAVLETAINQAQIMSRGGGVGYNASTIPGEILGAKSTKEDIVLYLPDDHKDIDILRDMFKLNKFDNVTLTDYIGELHKYIDEENYTYLKVEDSREGLLNGVKWMVEQIYQGNKVLIDFSDIRHKGALVKGVNGRSSGAPSWMHLYNVVAGLLHMDKFDAVDTMEINSQVTLLIEQGGSRRGALMIVLGVDHPNIKKFITRKRTMGYIQGANISVGVTDSFMKAKEVPGSEEEEIWNMIIKSAWASAEPGVIFLEYYNWESNSWYYAVIVATNPCGEQGLPPWAVCNLGHLVLSQFYDEKKNDVDWELLAKCVRAGVRFQDNIINYTPYFMKENEEQQMGERRVGMGTMGLGTLLIMMGIRYGSEEGLKFIDKLYKFIAVEAYKASIDLAIEKGKFPKCEPEKMAQSGFMKRLLPELPEEYREKFFKYGIRNVTILTQAPTGSTGTYIDNLLMNYGSGTTTGIEPYFAFEYWRASRSGFAKQEVRLVKDWKEKNPGKELPDYFVTAQDLSPEDHIRVQAAIQKWVDSSISKTANCPADFTVEDTRKLYDLAYKLGAKGVTIYRDGSREAQVLATDKEKAKLESDIEEEKLKKLKEMEEKLEELRKAEEKTMIATEAPKKQFQKRPQRLHGFTEKVTFVYGDNVGKAYITVNMGEDGQPWEVFIATKDKEVSSLAKALGLMTTKLLRLGCADDIVDQAIETLAYDQTMGTLPFHVSRILKEVQKENIKKEQEETGEAIMQKCPECGEQAYDKANCICFACGVSKCN